MFLLRVFLEFSIYSTVVLLRGRVEKQETTMSFYSVPVTIASALIPKKEKGQRPLQLRSACLISFPLGNTSFPILVAFGLIQWAPLLDCIFYRRSWSQKPCSSSLAPFLTSFASPRSGCCLRICLRPRLSFARAPGQRSLPAATLSLSPSAPGLRTFWPQTFFHTQPPQGTHAERPLLGSVNSEWEKERKEQCLRRSSFPYFLPDRHG